MITLATACVLDASSRWPRLALVAVAVALAATLVFTQSRGALAALLAGLVTVAFVRSRKAGLATIGILLVAAAVAYPAFSEWRFGNDGAASGANLEAMTSGRVDAWMAAADVVTDFPSSVSGSPSSRTPQGSASRPITGTCRWSPSSVSSVSRFGLCSFSLSLSRCVGERLWLGRLATVCSWSGWSAA